MADSRSPSSCPPPCPPSCPPSCPVCGKPGVAAYAPFCSKRCADVDLSRWLGGKYVVETQEAPEQESGED